MIPAARPPVWEAPADFSIVLGGPLFQLLRRTHLSDDALALVHRRVLAGMMITWVPLFFLSVLEGRAWGGVTVPFLLNAEVQGRFLLAMPLLIVAELGVHLRMRRLVAHFFSRDLIADEDRPRVKAAIESAMRLRNSLAAELTLIAVIYAVGIPMREYIAVDASTWASEPRPARQGGSISRSPAGGMRSLACRSSSSCCSAGTFVCSSGRASSGRSHGSISSSLPTHPDRVGGLGFLTNVVYAFAPVLVAHGVLLSGLIADRIFFDGAELPQFMVEIIGGVGALVLLVLCPLMVFVGQLARLKRTGLGEYGGLAQRYVREFDAKWLRGGPEPAEPLVGSADIQSLADLANSFQVIREIRFVPFSKETIMQLAVVTLAPVAPLLLTMISLEELLKRLLSAVF